MDARYPHPQTAHPPRGAAAPHRPSWRPSPPPRPPPSLPHSPCAQALAADAQLSAWLCLALAAAPHALTLSAPGDRMDAAGHFAGALHDALSAFVRAHGA